MPNYFSFSGPPDLKSNMALAAMAWVSDTKKAFSLKHSPSLGLNNLTSNVSNFVSPARLSARR